MRDATSRVIRLEKFMDFTSPENPHGIGIRVNVKDGVAYSDVTIPETMSGWQGPEQAFGHHGIVATILDTVMAFGGIHFLKRATATKGLSIEYFAQAPTHTRLRVEAKLVQKPCEDEAVLEGALRDAKGILIARATGTYALYSPAQLRDLTLALHPNLLLAPGVNPRVRSDAACRPADITRFENALRSM